MLQSIEEELVRKGLLPSRDAAMKRSVRGADAVPHEQAGGASRSIELASVAVGGRNALGGGNGNGVSSRRVSSRGHGVESGHEDRQG